MAQSPEDRIQQAKETIELLERIDSGASATLDDAAELHALHAAHERQHGRIDRAEEAEARAERARKLAAARDHPDG